jgi:hypothetical protein
MLAQSGTRTTVSAFSHSRPTAEGAEMQLP